MTDFRTNPRGVRGVTPRAPLYYNQADVVPAGGTVGQLLAKIDGTDFNTQWLAQSALSIAYTQLTYSGLTAGQVLRASAAGAAAFATLVAGDIPNLDWSKITSGKPTTLAGYGITDAYTKTASDALYAPIPSLTAGKIPKAASASTFANSILADDGAGNVSVDNGADADTKFKVGDPGAAPTAARSVTFELISPSSVTNVGSPFMRFARGASAVWFIGADTSVTGAKSANDDFMFQTGGGTNVAAISQGGNININGVYKKAGTQVVAARLTGWSNFTGTQTRANSGFVSTTATTAQIGAALAALIADLMTHGLIGT